MGDLKNKITNKLTKLTEAKLMVKPEDFDNISDKLGPDDVVKFVDENELDEVNQEVMNKFIDQYGEKKGKQIYYATANKQDRDPEDFHTESEGDDWDMLMQQANSEGMNEEGEQPQPNVNQDKLKQDVQRFLQRLNLGQFKGVLAKIDTPIEQAEMIASFGEMIGVPRAKLPMILSAMRASAKNESVNPRMKKSDLVEHVLRTKKTKK